MGRQVVRLFAAVLFVTAAWAQGSEWQIDPTHTTVGFSVRHLGISNVHGRFTKVTGSAIVNDSDMTKSSVNATIDVASINTGNDGRDNDLRSPNYFDATQFSTMTFKSKNILPNSALERRASPTMPLREALGPRRLPGSGSGWPTASLINSRRTHVSPPR